MIVSEYTNPFSICFNMLKLRYSVYDESITSLGFLKPDDKINVFINLETVWKYLSTVKDLDRKLVLNRDFKTTMVSDIINIAAHYKEFFKNNGLDTKVYLYTTDFNSESENFNEAKYNEDFRSYYLNKYNTNPKFVLLTESLIETILPKVRTICDFIPDVYFISSKNIDGSLIPLVIGEEMNDRQNFIISGDRYETQYIFENRFTHHLFLRSYAASSLSCKIEEYLKAICKPTELKEEEIALYQNRSFYLLLLSSIGDKYRSVEGLSGIGFKTLTKMIQQGIQSKVITKDTESIELLQEIFTGTNKEYIVENFNSLNLRNSYQLLLDGDKKEILSQIVDRSDLNSLLSLNKTIFKNCELRIESLLK